LLSNKPIHFLIANMHDAADHVQFGCLRSQYQNLAFAWILFNFFSIAGEQPEENKSQQ